MEPGKCRCRGQKKAFPKYRSGRKMRGIAKARCIFRVPQGGRGEMLLPGAEKGIPGVPQRSKNARKSESPMHFSGTARWSKREFMREAQIIGKSTCSLYLAAASSQTAYRSPWPQSAGLIHFAARPFPCEPIALGFARISRLLSNKTESQHNEGRSCRRGQSARADSVLRGGALE